VPDEVKQSENIELKEEVKEEIVAEVKKEEIKRNNIDKFIFNEIAAHCQRKVQAVKEARQRCIR